MLVMDVEILNGWALTQPLSYGEYIYVNKCSKKLLPRDNDDEIGYFVDVYSE